MVNTPVLRLFSLSIPLLCQFLSSHSRRSVSIARNKSSLSRTIYRKTTNRIPNRVLQSRDPDGYFWHPTSCAYFSIPNLARILLQNPQSQASIKGILDTEKPIRNPLRTVQLTRKGDKFRMKSGRQRPLQHKPS